MFRTLEQAVCWWQQAKAREQKAIADRREAEDAMLSLLGVSENMEGTENAECPGYKIKLTGRINRTVDGDALQEIAAEHGLSQHLGSLFRWKPSINMKEWKAADESITRPLSAAITSKPGRVSFQIEEVK